MKYILNLFGTGIRYWICEIPNPLFLEMEKIKMKNKVEWEQLLFDFDFLRHFGYIHWNELSTKEEQIGFLLSRQNKIEIKQGQKLLSRLYASDLKNQETLFPLYETINLSNPIRAIADHHILVLGQYENGLIAKYKINEPHFDITKLSFEISKIEELIFLSGISYEQKKIQCIAHDSLVIGFWVSKMD